MFKYFEFEEGSRIIAISDIHGDLSSFKELLERVSYDSQNDYLVIIGDLIEKGSENLATLQYIMSLSMGNDKVFVLKGHCDRVLENVMNNDKNIPETMKYLKHNELSIFHDTARNAGTSIETDEDLKYVLSLLKEEKEYLENLPTALISSDFVFVHAGIKDLENEFDQKYHLTARNFYNDAIDLNRYIIVGHYPVSNYSNNIINNNPIIDLDKKVISIDGGNCAKPTGQLNALIIEKETDSYTFTYRSVMNKEKRIFKTVQEGNEDTCKLIKWPNLEVKMKEPGEDKSLVTTFENEDILVDNDLLKCSNGKWLFASDYTDYYFTITKPKLGYVIYENDERILASIDGKIGWITK